MKAQQTILESAKRGDAAAIAVLMQAPLAAKGITVNAHMKKDCLQVNLVGQVCPPKPASMAFIRRGITHLDPEGVRAVRVDAYKTGETSPGWVARLNLHAPADKAAAIAPPQGDIPAARPNKAMPAILALLALIILGLVSFVVYRSNNAPTPQPTTEQS